MVGGLEKESVLPLARVPTLWACCRRTKLPAWSDMPSSNRCAHTGTVVCRTRFLRATTGDADGRDSCMASDFGAKPLGASNGGGRTSCFSSSSRLRSLSSSFRLADVAALSDRSVPRFVSGDDVAACAGATGCMRASESASGGPSWPELLGRLGTRVFGETLRLRSLSLCDCEPRLEAARTGLS